MRKTFIVYSRNTEPTAQPPVGKLLKHDFIKLDV